MNVTIDGESAAAFCVDLDHTIYNGLNYSAEILAQPAEEPWCAINSAILNWDATDGVSGAALQVAIWTLIYPHGNVSTSDSAVGAAVDEILADVSGDCPLTCDESVSADVSFVGDSGGQLTALVTLDRAGGPAVAGQSIEATVSGGTLVSPAGGLTWTDGGGAAELVIEPDGSGAVSVSLALYGQTISTITPTTAVQELIAVTDTCDLSASGAWSAAAFGDPRTIGFWKHQAKTANGGKGKNHVDAATLESYLPLDVLGTTISSLDELEDILWLQNASMEERAVQQCTASLLNLSNDQVGWFTDIDGTPFWALYGSAQDDFDAGDYESAKTTCDDFNNL